MNWFSIIVVGIMMVFAIAGIVDRIFLKNRLGLGAEFEKGINMIGPLCLAIVGIISLVPLFSEIISRTLSPLYLALGIDPSMAVATFLAIDMGGFQLAESVALDATIGQWAGVIYGSMMGATIVFTIPVGLSTIKKKDNNAFSRGILYGIAAIPLGTFIGGVMMGIPLFVVVKNLILPTLFSILIIICLLKWPEKITKVFCKISEGINTVALIGLGLAMIKDFVLLPLVEAGAIEAEAISLFGMIGSTSDGIATAGAIGLMLAGALPFVVCLKRWLKKPLKKIGKKFEMTETGITGFLLSSANAMATFAVFDEMKHREQVLNTAFAVGAAFVIGDHLAFTAAYAPNLIMPMMVSKIITGVTAVGMAILIYRKEKKHA